jgi:phosphoribosylamine---glycine ligase
MNVLVVGGGAREHVICSAVARSKNTTLFSVMGNRNPGIEQLAKEYVVEKETNIAPVTKYAKSRNIELALVGPEAPLEAGLVDSLQAAGISCCAPTKAAARIETNKEWMRGLLARHQIPGQLAYEVVTSQQDAKAFIDRFHGEVAIKPIGLTGGKGVRVAGDHFTGVQDALGYVNEVIEKRIGGSSRVLLEEKAVGEEFTLQAFSDGEHLAPLPAVQDHKRLLPEDKGPNTGGMGSYSCIDGLLPFLRESEYKEGLHILELIVLALRKDGHPYVGPIYGQFMLTRADVKLIEINARFGDPEAMNVLPLLQTDFLEVCSAMLSGGLSKEPAAVAKKSTVCKYVVPEGYGVKSMSGYPISVDENAIRSLGALLFYASVNKTDDAILTGSSRSVAVVGVADTIENAEKQCEAGLSHVQGEHLFVRHDIGTRPLLERRSTHMQKIRGKP